MQQQLEAQETIFSSNASQLVSSYFSQMSEQFRSLKTGKGTQHYKLLSGNILGQNQVSFQAEDEMNDVNDARNEQLRQNRLALLERSFFIFELSNEEELDTDEDRMHEKLRFFYTHGTVCHPNDQLFIIGFIQAFLVFTQAFHPMNEPVSIIHLLNSQFCLIHFNENRHLLVVCAPITVPMSCLENLTHRMVKCISMFHGVQSPFHTSNNFPHNQFDNRMNDFGIELSALIDRFHESPVDLFNPLGYVELPPRSNAVFLSGVYLLDELLDFFMNQSLTVPIDSHRNSSIDSTSNTATTTTNINTREIRNKKNFFYLGACVLYDENVLCNQLPEIFVKDFVLFRLLCINRFIFNKSGKVHKKRAETMEDLDLEQQQQQQQQRDNRNTNNTNKQKSTDDSSRRNSTDLKHSFSTPRARRSDWVYITESMSSAENFVPDLSELDLSDNEDDEDEPVSFNVHCVFDTNERIDVCKVYPDIDVSRTLRTNAARLITETASTYYQQKAEEDEEDNIEPKPLLHTVVENHTTVGLFVYKYGNTSLVAAFEITDPNPHLVQRAITKHLRSECARQMGYIDRKLEKIQLLKTFKQIPTTTQNQPTADVSRNEVENQPYVLVDRMRVKKQKASAQVRRSSNGDARSSVMLLNTSDQMLTTNSTSESFLQRCSLAHELLNSEHHSQNDKSMAQITKLYLKSASHLLYAKKMFNTEVIYHQQVQQGAVNQAANKSVEHFKLENLENNVRDAIRKDFQINML